MAENAWLLNDVAPTDIGQAFATPASPSTAVYWGGPSSLQFATGGVDGTANPAGVGMLAAVGSVVATGTAFVGAVGVSSSASVGTATATGTGRVTAAGVQALALSGNATATGHAVANLLGVAAIAAVGTAVASGESVVDATASPVGVFTMGSVGTAQATGTALTAPAGVALLAGVGTPVADGGPANATASPFGVAMVASVGQATAADASLVVVSGGMGRWTASPAPVPRDAGELRVSVTVFPFGVDVTAHVGRATASGNASCAVTGLGMVADCGDVQASADAVIAATGVSSAMAVGKAAAFDVHVLPVLRYTAFRVDVVGSPLGVDARASVGTATAREPDAIDRAWSNLQSEDDELLLLGVLS